MRIYKNKNVFESALDRIRYLYDEFEGRVVVSMSGIDTAGKAGKKDFFISSLPYMFKDWQEYRDYLLENITEDPDLRKRFTERFKQMDEMYGPEVGLDVLSQVQVQSIVTNDADMVKLSNWERAPQNYNIRRKIQGKSWFEPKAKR